MIVYYVNHLGKKINLMGDNITIQDYDVLYNTDISYNSVVRASGDSRITNLYRGMRKFDITLSVFFGDKYLTGDEDENEIEFAHRINAMENVFYSDVDSLIPGQLCVNGWALDCYVVAVTYSDYNDIMMATDVKLSIVSANSMWYTEYNALISNTKTTHLSLSGYVYPKLVIRGNSDYDDSINEYPDIVINDNRYNLFANPSDVGYKDIVIDSFRKSVYVGDETNKIYVLKDNTTILSRRNKKYGNILKEIYSSGEINVNSYGYGFDYYITFYQLRSAPYKSIDKYNSYWRKKLDEYKSFDWVIG